MEVAHMKQQKINDILQVIKFNMRKNIFYGFLFLCWIKPLWSFDHTHAQFDSILKKYVHKKDSIGEVDYKALKLKEDSLKKYLDSLSKVTKKEYKNFSNMQKLAFLINAYNGFTLQLIIDHYPVKSIKKIGSIFTSVWNVEFFTFLEEKSTLSYIEHEKLRKEFNEPRIHFAINCASIGCPALQPYAYRADKMEEMLSFASKEFMNDRKRNYYVRKDKELYVSKIFKWFQEDFEKKYGSLENFLALYLAKKTLDKKDFKEKKVSINWTDYDWNLNELKNTKR